MIQYRTLCFLLPFLKCILGVTKEYFFCQKDRFERQLSLEERLNLINKAADYINFLDEKNIAKRPRSLNASGQTWGMMWSKDVSGDKSIPFTTLYYSEELDFDLAAGMKVRLEALWGADWHMIRFEQPNHNIVYEFSNRWNYYPPRAVFNVRQGGVFGPEELLIGISVGDINNYVIEIQMNESAFMTYVDGALWMTNKMRLPFTDVRAVSVKGITSLRSFRIGYVLC